MRKLSYIGAIAVTFSMLISGIAMAQVASPKLNSIGLNGSGLDTTHPVNPAVLPWSGPSRVAVGAYDLTLEGMGANPPPVTGTASGNVLQANFIGETFSLGLDSSSMTVEIPDIPPGSAYTGEFKDTLVGFAIRLGESMAIGFGQQSSERTDSIGGNPNGTTTKTLPMIGGVLQLGASLFIGGTYGTETVEKSDSILTISAERAVSRVGVGFYKKNEKNSFHLEVYAESTDLLEFFDPANNLVYAEDSATTGAALEVQFGKVFFGVEKITRAFTEVYVVNFAGNTGGTYAEKEESNTMLSIGWAPMKGMQLVLSSISIENKNSTDNSSSTLDGLFLGVGYAF